MIAKMIMAKSKSKAMLTKGPIAFPIADITTCRPENQSFVEYHLLYSE